MIARRSLLFAAVAALPAPALAQPRAIPMPEDAFEPSVARRRPARLRTPRLLTMRPGAPGVWLHAGIGAERGLVVRFSGAGAPEGAVTLPSWYGYGRVFATLRLRGRDIVLAAFEGNRGTGVYQEIMAAIGVDDAGRLRILGLETLSYRVSGPCAETGRIDATLRPGSAADTLGYEARLLHRDAECRRGSAPRREAWRDALHWDGRGAFASAPLPARAGAGQRRAAEIRALTTAWLATPRQAVTLDDVEALRLMETLPE